MSENRVLLATIPGEPRTQGSMKLFRGVHGNEVATYAKTTVEHRNWVISQLMEHWDGRPPIDGPVAVQMRFFYPRPKGHFGTGRNAGSIRASAPYWPASRINDVDKAARLVNDALTYAGVISDDGMICVLRVEKRYQDAGLSPCTVVEVHTL